MALPVRLPIGSLAHYRRPIRFGMVGVVGATINSALLFTLITWGRLNPVLAGAFATELAILCNFALNDRWTFAGKVYRRPWLERAVRYNAIALGGLAVSVGTLATLIRFAGMYPMIANIFAMMASFALNYTANKRFTFVGSDSLLVELP